MTNVLLLTLDSLRYDHVSWTESPMETTPFLAELAAEGTVFEAAVATGPTTATSFPAILAGRYPMDHGYTSLNDEHVPLAAALTDQDVATIGITGNVGTSALFDYDRGFDVFRDTIPDRTLDLINRMERFPVDSVLGEEADDWERKLALTFRDNREREVPYSPADELTDIALETVPSAAADGDSFTWIHYMDPHYPYAPPEWALDSVERDRSEINRAVHRWFDEQPARGPRDGDCELPVSPETVEEFNTYYRAEIRFLDEQLRRLWSGLSEEGLLEETVVIVCADHGEEFLDHDDFGHRPKLYEELLRVPMLVYDGTSGSFPAEKRVSTPVSLVDIPRTVADVLDCDPAEEWRGRSLREPLRNDPERQREYVLSELCHREGLSGPRVPEEAVVSVRTAGWKYICDRQREQEELYDLDSDPGERVNRREQAADVRTSLSEQCAHRLAAIDGRQPVGDGVPAVAEQRLKQLGYRK